MQKITVISFWDPANKYYVPMVHGITPEEADLNKATWIQRNPDLWEKSKGKYIVTESTRQLTIVTPETPTDIHTYFELSYANYLVLHRTLLQSMPLEWQHQFTDLLEQLDDAFQHIEKAPGYQVTPVHWAYPGDLPKTQLEALGWAVQEADPDDENDKTPTLYYDPESNEHDGVRACVPIPVEDPIPHYDRGRAFVQPKITSAPQEEGQSGS